MPLFNRKPQAADANTATAVGTGDSPATEKIGLKGLLSKRNRTPAQERAAYGYDNLNARPRFGQWLKGIVFLIVTSSFHQPELTFLRSSTLSLWSSWVSLALGYVLQGTALIDRLTDTARYTSLHQRHHGHSPWRLQTATSCIPSSRILSARKSSPSGLQPC